MILLAFVRQLVEMMLLGCSFAKALSEWSDVKSENELNFHIVTFTVQNCSLIRKLPSPALPLGDVRITVCATASS